MRDRIFYRTRLMFVSPWLSGAAIGLLALIILIFAANNIRREQGVLRDVLFQKGQALIRFIEAGTRATMMTSMIEMMGMIQFQSGLTRTQSLIEQAAEDPDIHFIAVVDDSGKIIAHSNPELIGSSIGRDPALYATAEPLSKFHIIESLPEKTKVFEVYSRFDPFKGRLGLNRWRQQFLNQHPLRGDEANPEIPPVDDLHRLVFGVDAHTQVILVGLDMAALENAIHQHRVQVTFLSLALLLVGLGGLISLMAAQGYQVSQETLKRIQAFTGLLISRLPVGIIATDQAGRIRTFNEAAARMSGGREADATGAFPGEVLRPELADFFSEQGECSGLCERDIILDGGDGSRLVLHLSSVPVFNQDNNYMGKVLLMYDLTDLKKLENEVRRHDRLVALGKMAAGVAHEVRNPLSSIKGFATLLGAKFSEGSKEQEAADLLVQEADRLNRSITELLNYARPTPLKLQRVDFAELLAKSLRLISTDADSLGVTVSLQLPAAPLPEIAVDPDRMNQVLLNLYLNGLQAMTEKGTLTVSVKPAPENDFIEVLIQDSGVGIPPENMERILDPYFTTKADGTGLGLAMAYKIVDEHGGTIRFESQPGQGTTVILSLPAGQPA